MTMSILDPYALGRDGLAALLDDQPRYRADQVHRWLVRGVDDPAEMTDLPLDLRQRLAELLPPPPALLRSSSADGGLTRKVLLGFPAETGPRSPRTDVRTKTDGEIASGPLRTGVEVESVLMCYPARDGKAGRATVCISTQAGCAMGCPF
ncbi:MAG: hypothetical protein M3425_10975, partial [Actinomycetota bacterium]|nr:hypothetical protein [Actinomycetota bacterium]